jgi:hypothetical protein
MTCQKSAMSSPMVPSPSDCAAPDSSPVMTGTSSAPIAVNRIPCSTWNTAPGVETRSYRSEPPRTVNVAVRRIRDDPDTERLPA